MHVLSRVGNQPSISEVRLMENGPIFKTRLSRGYLVSLECFVMSWQVVIFAGTVVHRNVKHSCI